MAKTSLKHEKQSQDAISVALITVYIGDFFFKYTQDEFNIANSHRLKSVIVIQCWNTEGLLSKSESVKFSLIESVICLFTDSSVKKYFSLLNQLIFTEIISEIWLIYSNPFLAILISQISLIISRFWLIQI